MLGIIFLTFVVMHIMFRGDWKVELYTAAIIVGVLGWPISAIFLPRLIRKAKRKDYFGEE